jgi:hypothetical protein
VRRSKSTKSTGDFMLFALHALRKDFSFLPPRTLYTLALLAFQYSLHPCIFHSLLAQKELDEMEIFIRIAPIIAFWYRSTRPKPTTSSPDMEVPAQASSSSLEKNGRLIRKIRKHTMSAIAISFCISKSKQRKDYMTKRKGNLKLMVGVNATNTKISCKILI